MMNKIPIQIMIISRVIIKNIKTTIGDPLLMMMTTTMTITMIEFILLFFYIFCY